MGSAGAADQPAAAPLRRSSSPPLCTRLLLRTCTPCHPHPSNRRAASSQQQQAAAQPEQPPQPAPLVLPEVTPATRLLEKRRQQFEADEKLEAAKAAYAAQAR